MKKRQAFQAAERSTEFFRKFHGPAAGAAKTEDEIYYEARTLRGQVNIFLEKKHLTLQSVADRSEIDCDNLKRYLSEKRKPRREQVIRIAMALLLDKEEANRLLDAAGYADLKPIRRDDGIILAHYDTIVDFFKRNDNTFAHNPAIEDLNTDLIEEGEEPLFGGQYE